MMNDSDLEKLFEEQCDCFYANEDNDRLCFIFNGALTPTQMQGVASRVRPLLCRKDDKSVCLKPDFSINEACQRRNLTGKGDRKTTSAVFYIHLFEKNADKKQVTGAQALKLKLMLLFKCLRSKDCERPKSMNTPNLVRTPGHELG